MMNFTGMVYVTLTYFPVFANDEIDKHGPLNSSRVSREWVRGVLADESMI